MPRAAAAKKPAPATRAVSKPLPKGAYADKALGVYTEAKDYVTTQMPVILGLIMKTRKLSFDDLSGMMGLSPSAIRHRIYGRTEFSAAEMVGLAAALGISPAAFYDPNFDIGTLLRPPA